MSIGACADAKHAEPAATATAASAPSTYRGEDRLLPLVDEFTDGTAQTRREVETRVTACMQAQGFRYLAITPLAVEPHGNPDDPSSRATSGYGVAHSLQVRREAPADPNRPYRDSLGAAQRAAYDLALGGSPEHMKPIVDEHGRETGSYITDGCVAEALRATRGYDIGQAERFAEAVESRRNEALAALSADSRWKAVWSEWSSCMAGSGWSAPDRTELIEQLTRDAATDPAAAAAQEQRAVQADNTCSALHHTDEQVWQLRYTSQQTVLDALEPILAEVGRLRARRSAPG